MQANAVAASRAIEGVASFERPIDLVHLARQTLGDRSLEQEILSLYLKQAKALLERIKDCGGVRDRCDLAHTLVGSSRAVGAWKVARAAEAVEISPPDNRSELTVALEHLEICVEAACDTIRDLQRAH
jgi:HPt (histidine-containing phosphotransfer) domain-containing protein